MSLGKDSIQKPVAKPAEAAPKAPAAKTPAPKAPAAAEPAVKEPAAKAPAKRGPGRPRVKTAVLTNVAPETVAKTVKAGGFSLAEKYALGCELPYYLL